MRRRSAIPLLLPAGLACLAVLLFIGPDVAAFTGDFAVVEGPAVVDMNGRRIPVEKPFSRIISLYAAHAENLFALGAGESVIGVSRSASHPPEALERPRYSYHDDPEKFLAARPDLVLIRPMIDRGYFQLMARLEKSGIRVVSLQPGTVAEMYRYWEILGLLTGRRDAADAMVARFRTAAAGFRALTADVHPRKRVYFEAIHDRMKTFTRDAMAVFALETAGGVNVAGDAVASRGTNIAIYGKERILAQADRIDVYLAQRGAMNRPTPELIRNEPGFGLIRAVKAGEIHIVEEEIVSRPTPRLLLGIYEIGRILYPDRFDDRARAILKEASPQ